MKYKLEWNYQLPGNEKILCSSEYIDEEKAKLAGEELENLAKVSDLLVYDETGTSWTLKEMKKLTAEIEEDPHDVTIFFDGGFQKETNQAGLGAVIFFKQGKKKYRVRVNEKFDEMETNNEAEYAALFFALNLLEELGVHHLPCEIKGDSQVVLKQLEGEWPCYEEVLNRWLDRIEAKINKLGLKPKYTAITRNENKEADKLAGQALKGKRIFAKTQLL